MIDINQLIANAMKNREREKLSTYKLIKSELVNVEKSGITLDEDKVNRTLIKMVEQRKDVIKEYNKANRTDLAEKEQKEIEIINELLPPMPTDEDIIIETQNVINEMITINAVDWNISMKDMKTVLNRVKETYPMANGAIVSNVLKKYIG